VALAPDALAPTSHARGVLVLFLNGSGGSPAGTIADPQKNFHAAAVAQGDAVLALSYASKDEIGALCVGNDACFFPTRQTLIEGVPQPGVAPKYQGLALDEGIVPRTVLALQYLAARDPAHGWSSFLAAGDAGAAPDWSKIVVAGHSQGGGHAAAMGKLFLVQRVLQLSSTCDEVNGAAATWTGGSTGAWASAPSGFWGLSAATTFTGGKATGGDTICPAHAVDWKNLGMTPARSNDGAATCGAATGVAFHAASIRCADNYDAWVTMLQ